MRWIKLPDAGVESPRVRRQNHEPIGIEKINRIPNHISIEVRRTADESDRVLGNPAPDRWVVVSISEPNELCVRIEQPAPEPEGLEAGIRISHDVAPLVIIDLLGH